MKKSKTCPKCKSKEVYYFDSVADSGESFGVFKLKLGTNKSHLLGKKGGVFEAYACSKCGYTEFYVKKPEDIIEGNVGKKVR